jgi:uncharacterized delta-60 repeat protein
MKRGFVFPPLYLSVDTATSSRPVLSIVEVGGQKYFLLTSLFLILLYVKTKFMKRFLFLLVFGVVFAKNSQAQPGSLDPTFNTGTGFNSVVNSISIQEDGKIIIGGGFTSYNGTPSYKIVRLNADGSLDPTFNTGTGFIGTVNSISIQEDGKIIIGGDFTSYNGTTRNHIARINADGSLDTDFNPGDGANYWVRTAALQPDGKIIIVGHFTSYNGTAINRIARLNADGSLDTGFNPGTGADTQILTAALQPDGKIIIGGGFTYYNGTAINRTARINADGSLDTGFNPGMGVGNGSVYSISIQEDGKIIIGGSFTSYNGTTRNHIARINADGSLDTDFNPGVGANNWVYTTALQSDGKIIIGGRFTSYNGTTRNSITRINDDGSLDMSFNPGNGANLAVWTTALQPDGKIIIGGAFTSYNGTAINRIAQLNVNGIWGLVYNDINQNCVNDNDAGIAGRKALINPGNIVVETDQTGYWYLDSLSTGTYTITADTSGKWRRTCDLTKSFTITGPYSFYIAPSFGLVSTEPCSEPNVSIHFNRMRPGFSNQKVYVKACNEYIATGALVDGYVDVALDELITVDSCLMSYTDLGDNTFRFDVGTLNPGQCVSFNLSTTLSVSAVLGQTLCVEANLFPVESCVLDTVPTPTPPDFTPCDLPWDKSSILVEGACVNGEIIFTITNTGDPGDGDMDCFSPVRLYIDGEYIWLDSLKLNGGETFTYTFTGDGRTWRLRS